MAAAYAALVSVMYIIDQIQQHPRPPLILTRRQVGLLTENVSFLQRFLEGYTSSGSKEEDDLESRIANAAYAAEDVIESHIVDRIPGRNISSIELYQRFAEFRSTSREKKTGCFNCFRGQEKAAGHGEKISSYDRFCLGLQRVIEDMDSIKEEVETIKEKMGAQDQLHRNSSVSTGSARPASTGQNSNSTMVSFDDVLLEDIMDKLTGGPNNLQIIPIVGMGGIGKTTLARNIFANPLIVPHFDSRAWVTISREYDRREILHVLCQRIIKGSLNDLSQMSEDELGQTLRKDLWGRRYLIVMDDIWSVEVWDKVKFFFPNNNNGSRIMMTTRLSNLAFELSGFQGFQMEFLDEDKSWNLLCKIVFGKEGCPIDDLENIGKKIAKNCRGLPLSLVVIGGVLAKSIMTREYWKYTLENLNSLINLENNEHCLQILHTSYKELPIYLKPCFLYMGVFPEDDEIRVPDLIKLWVAEGFVRPIDGKSLEAVAKVYLKELIDRNLILVHELRWNREPRWCKIHDLLKDLCLREAQKQKFLCILKQEDLHTPQGKNTERCICIRKYTRGEYSPEFLHALESASLTRSLLISGSREPSPSVSFRLLRVYSRVDKFHSYVRDLTSVDDIFQQANLRYLSIDFDFHGLSKFPSSWSLLWNLQTIKIVVSIPGKPVIAPSEIWDMFLLRHAELDGLVLPRPAYRGGECFVLRNLRTLSGIWNMKCGVTVVTVISNVKKLKLNYDAARLEEGLPKFRLNNLDQLQKLKSLCLDLSSESDAISDPELFRSRLAQNLTFPHSLKKLTLKGTKLYWEELMTKIGSLPILEVVRLARDACIGPEWETVEGQFCSLKFLLIDYCADLKYWTTDSTHFPLLEHLVLLNIPILKEIPSSIGEIPTLQSIQLKFCGKSATDSAKRIKAEQEELGNADFKVQIEEEEEEEDQEEEEEEEEVVLDEKEDQVVSDGEED